MLSHHHSKDVNFKFQLNGPVSLIMVTITRHVFIDFFQSEHFSAVKFDMGYEKNKISLSLKKVGKIGLGSFN